MPATKIPHKIPVGYVVNSGVSNATSDIDTGGYDIMIDGVGFRLATDQNFPYARSTEPSTVQRFDDSAEPNEHSLSALPWIKSQSSFHGGAGQLNLEAPLSSFQYQEAHVEHLRFDTSLGVDVWTPGQVKRLPDTTLYNFGFTSTCMVTASVNNIDYAIVGGAGVLYQVAWLAGPNAAPTITAIDLSSSTYGGAANCTITSLATDGINYFGVLQLTAAAGVVGLLTYVISGPVTSTAAPKAIYEVPGFTAGPSRVNMCTNPGFEVSTAGWSNGAAGSSLATTTAHAFEGTQSMLCTWGTSAANAQSVLINFTTVIGTQYTLSAYVWVPAAQPRIAIAGTNPGFAPLPTAISPPTTTNGAWERISATFTATQTTSQLTIRAYDAPTAGNTCYVDAVLIEATGVLGSYFDGATFSTSTYTFAWNGASGISTSTASPILQPVSTPGLVGWSKERLIAGLGSAIYELPSNPNEHSALPSPKYTHPVSGARWTAISDSPVAILVSVNVGLVSSILKFTLDSSGGTPVLAGGATIAVLPLGEQVVSMSSSLGSFLAIGTNYGMRIATFDTYTGAMKYGPLSVKTTQPVLALTNRDRFVYGGYTNQQADGKTGLVRLDLSQEVDSAGRLAWAPDLRPPSSAPTGMGVVSGVSVLPYSQRIAFITPEGIHVEGSGPGTDGSAWLRTSRIRFGTAENKLFKLGSVNGTIDTASIQVTGIAPFTSDVNLATVGPISGGQPGEFRLPSGLTEWIQLKFSLIGSSCVMNSYYAKALPAPKRQHLITFTVNCFLNEVDRAGIETTDVLAPRDRLAKVKDIESSGREVRFTEFTNTGPIAELVVIDQCEFRSYDRPSQDTDFGGYITFKLRSTEN